MPDFGIGVIPWAFEPGLSTLVIIFDILLSCCVGCGQLCCYRGRIQGLKGPISFHATVSYSLKTV